jgi:hypothetical protein
MKLVFSATCIGIAVLAAACSQDVEPEGTGTGELRSEFTASVTTTPSTVVAGQRAHVEVRVKGRGGAPVLEFDPLHTQPLHFIGVSSDLEDFIHIHPQLGQDGVLSDDTTFARAEPYGIFLEFDPKGPPAATMSRANVKPYGATYVAPRLDGARAFDGAASRTTTVSNTVVELAPVPDRMIMANTPTTITVKFKNPDGTAIEDLVDWLEMPAHAIVVSPDLETFVHAHGMAQSGGHDHGHGGHGATSTTSGPVFVDMTLPKEGLYKMFLQFQRGTSVITAPFVLSVMASHEPPHSPCDNVTCPPGTHCMVHGGVPMCH